MLLPEKLQSLGLLESPIVKAIRVPKKPKKRKKSSEGPDLETCLKRIYVLDAVNTLYRLYRDKLPPTKKGTPTKWFSDVLARRLPRLQFESGEVVDYLFDNFMNQLDNSEQKALGKYLKKLERIKVTDVVQVRKNWDRKVEVIDAILTSPRLKRKFKELIGNKHIRILRPYVESEKSKKDAALLVAKAKTLLKGDLPILSLARFTLKNLKKHDEAFLKRITNSGGLSDDDLNFIKDETEPKKVTKRVAKKTDITPKTHPEYFTREKPYELLWKPIPLDALNLHIEKPKKSPKTGKWSYYATFTDPSSGEKVTTYLQKHQEENQSAKADTVRKFEKKGYDDLVKKNKTFLESDSYNERVLALIVQLVHAGHFRIGNPASEKEGVFGIHNLQVKHVKIGGRNVTFSYTGKKLKYDTVTIKCSPKVLRILKGLLKSKSKNDYIFTDSSGEKISEGAVNKFLKRKLKVPKGITIHKFRHIATTRMFREKIAENLPKGWKNMSLEDKVKWYQEGLEEIRQGIRHDTIKTTIDSYIDPKIFQTFNKENGFEGLSLTAKNPLRGLKKAEKKTKREKRPKKSLIVKVPKKVKEIGKRIKKKKSLEDIKKAASKKPKKLVVKVRKKKGIEDIVYTGDEIKDLEAEIDNLLKKYKAKSSVDHNIFNTAILKVEASYKAKELMSRTLTNADAIKVLAAMKKHEWKKGSRALVEVDKEIFTGTVTAVRQGKVHIELDNGRKVNFKDNSKFLLGPTLAKKRKSAILPNQISKWLLEDKREKKPKKEKDHGPIPKKPRGLQKTIEKVLKRLETVKSKEKKAQLKKRLAELKAKQSARFKKAEERLAKQEEKQRKIAEKEARRLEREKKREKRLEKKQARDEAKKLRAKKKLEREAIKKAREIEKTKKDKEKTAKKKIREQAQEKKKKTKTAKQKDKIEKSRKKANKIAKQLEEDKRAKERDNVARPKQKTPKVKTPKSLIVKVPKKPKKKPTGTKKVKKGMANTLRSIRNVLGKQLTGVPKLFLEPSNLMFLTPYNTKKKDTVGIKFDVIEDDKEFICSLTAYLDKNNYIEAFFNGRSDEWFIPNDQSFGVARTVTKKNGYINDGRFLEALKELIEEAKVRSGYVDNEEVFLKNLQKTLKSFTPALTKDKESLTIDAPIYYDKERDIQYEDVEDPIELPNLDIMTLKQLRAFAKKNALKIKNVDDLDDIALKTKIRQKVRDINADRLYRGVLKKTSIERQKRGDDLYTVLIKDGWTPSSSNTTINFKRDKMTKIYLKKGRAEILLHEQGSLFKQTKITPISLGME